MKQMGVMTMACVMLCCGLAAVRGETAARAEADAPAEPTIYAVTMQRTDDGKEQIVEGQPFRPSELRGRFVAMHFLLKTRCPICQRTTIDYHHRADEVAGVTHLFIKPDTPLEIAAWTAGLGKRDGEAPVIHRDPDAALAAYHRIPDGYAFHGQQVHFPALVLLNSQGKEVFRYVGKNNGDRLPFETFARKVAELSPHADINHQNLGEHGLAIQGYDPVSYFEGEPKAGSPEITSQYRGQTFQFASTESRHLFAQNPGAYLPAYGGWCATAMAGGKKVGVDPAAYKITDGRLLLFYKGPMGNALTVWNKDEANLMKRADTQWEQITGE